MKYELSTGYVPINRPGLRPTVMVHGPRCHTCMVLCQLTTSHGHCYGLIHRPAMVPRLSIGSFIKSDMVHYPCGPCHGPMHTITVMIHSPATWSMVSYTSGPDTRHLTLTVQGVWSM